MYWSPESTTCGTNCTEKSDEGTSYKLTQEGVSIGEDCENQSDGDYCDSISRVDYDYSDCATVNYVFTVVFTGARK